MTTLAEFLSTPIRASLTTEQERRAECLRLALALTHGRSVPIQIVFVLARWIASGVAHGTNE